MLRLVQRIQGQLLQEDSGADNESVYEWGEGSYDVSVPSLEACAAVKTLLPADGQDSVSSF